MTKQSLPQTISKVVEQLADVFDAHPERRIDFAEDAIMRGEHRTHPVFYLNHAPDVEMTPQTPPAPPPRRSPEENLLECLRGLTAPLAMFNPIAPRLGFGRGPGTLAASFGIGLSSELGNTPYGERPIDEVLAEGMPDPETSGVIPEIRENIEAALALTPDWIKIAPPDMQGPFNIAHMVLGTEVFSLPLTDPEKFARFMEIVTDFFLALSANLRCWIGPQRFPNYPTSTSRICECSINMMSPQMYIDHVLPHDLRIAEAYGEIAIHPCSGPHVFRTTLQRLPNVVYTEAGYIAKAYAGSISVDEALALIGDRPIILSIGQELPEGREEEFIQRDLDRVRTNPRLSFNYTGMHWQSRDREKIREIHLRLDDYWRRNVMDV